MVERDDVDAALRDPRQAAGTVGRDLDGIALPLQFQLDEPAQVGIVIDIENAGARRGHQAASGTCMTVYEQSELLDCMGKFLIIDRLGDVDVAAQIVAALDFSLVIGRRQHDHGQKS